MRKISIQIIILALFIVLPVSALNIRQSFDFDWQFHLGDDKAIASVGFIPDGWKYEHIQLPHDWSTTFKFNPKGSPESGFLDGGIGWCRKTFDMPVKYRGRRISVIFDGIYHKATIYLNGKEVNCHRYGYTSFEVDLTPNVIFGDTNVICVRVDHTELSRWYTGSGIYRHAWLLVREPVHVKTWGTAITTQVKHDGNVIVNSVTTIENNSATDVKVEVCQRIINPYGKVVGRYYAAKDEMMVPAHGQQNIVQQMMVTSPLLWDITSPNRYTLKTIVRVDGKVMNAYVTRFGIRTVTFDSRKGFLLNGNQIKLQGVCLHQDAGCLGVGVPDRAYVKRLMALKNIGVNAIRCSHNPPSPEFLDACDSLGLVVIDEAFDKWKSGYYAAFFDDCWQQDISDMVIRDRNHPCIVLWSIGNETKEANMKNDEGVNRARMLQDFVHKLDPSRKVMVALQPVYTDKFAGVTDVVGYNYGELSLINDKKNHPERIGLISEQFPYYSGMRPYKARDYSDRHPWNYVAGNDYICGAFLWAGIDYTGESMEWPSKGWAAAVLDACLDEKPVADYYRSVWGKAPVLRMEVVDYSLDVDPGKDHWQAPPMAHDWTFPYTDARVLPIHTATNCDSVVLIDPQGNIYGPRCPKDYLNQTIIWNQPYRPGKIIAIGYKDGHEVIRDSIETSASKAATFEIRADRKHLLADGQDLVFINLQLVDDKGVPVRIDDRMVTVKVRGSGRLRGINSGEMRRDLPFNSDHLKTFLGKCQVVAQSARQSGVIKIGIKVKGLGAQRLSLHVGNNKKHETTTVMQ